MDAHEFVTFMLASGWPRLGDDDYAGLTEEEKEDVQRLDGDYRSTVCADLLHLCSTCVDKLTFAESYRKAKRDALYVANEWPGEGNYSAKANELIREIMLRDANMMLNAMAIWFSGMLGSESLLAKKEGYDSNEAAALRHKEIEEYGIDRQSGRSSGDVQPAADMSEAAAKPRLQEPTTVGGSDGWPRLHNSIVGALPGHEQLLIRQHEEELIAASKLQLADICNNCHIRAHFAETYRVLHRDLGESLQQARAGLANPSQQFSDAFGAAMINSTDSVIRHKLNLMARHFFTRWGQPIDDSDERHGSPLDKAGCCMFLLIAGSALGSVMFILLTLTGCMGCQ